MRRVKSDKLIISDLPEKNEMKIYVDLSQEQASIYQDLVEKTLQEIKESSSDQRKKRGIILTLLVKLKHHHHLNKE